MKRSNCTFTWVTKLFFPCKNLGINYPDNKNQILGIPIDILSLFVRSEEQMFSFVWTLPWLFEQNNRISKYFILFLNYIFNQLILILWLGWSVCMYVCMYVYVCKCVSMKRLALFICISGTILWNLIKLCMNIILGYAVILPFKDFYLRGQTNVAYV